MANLENKAFLLVAAAVASGCVNWHPYGAEEMRNGMVSDWYNHATVYTTEKVCDAYCQTTFRPYRPAPGERPAGDFTIIKAADGSEQWAYKGKPLYTYVKDTKTGDTLGQGVDGIWSVVK